MKKQELLEMLNSITVARAQKLYHCQAEVGSVRLGLNTDSSYEILYSYGTIVAAYSYKTKSVIVFDYFSATSSQHIGKFIKWLGCKVNIVLYAYIRSDKKISVYINQRNKTQSRRTYSTKECNDLISADFESIVNSFIG